jgi:hypothetical protein
MSLPQDTTRKTGVEIEPKGEEGSFRKEEHELESSKSDSDFEDNKSVKVTKKGSGKTYSRIPFNYDCLSCSTQYISVPLEGLLVLMKQTSPHGGT